MKSMVAKKAGSPFVEEDRQIPQPGPHQVRVKVHACGICHSDHLIADKLWPGLELPRIPGHEIAGVIDEVGPGIKHLKPGMRVGVGWYGGHDGTCDACKRGDFILCQQGKITGITSDGGYQEFMIASAHAIALIPEKMSFNEAAPLLCAGVTTFNSLRNSPARSGDIVAIQGLGGLGHLGVQFARAMGFEVVSISRGKEKEEFARQLGAHHYIDTLKENLGVRLSQMGGAKVILATAPDAKSISALVPGLGMEGCLTIVGAPFEPLQINAIDLISRRARVQGWPSGIAADSTDTLNFSALHGIHPMIETFSLSEANRAYQKMMDGSVRFRAVLEVAKG